MLGWRFPHGVPQGTNSHWLVSSGIPDTQPFCTLPLGSEHVCEVVSLCVSCQCMSCHFSFPHFFCQLTMSLSLDHTTSFPPPILPLLSILGRSASQVHSLSPITSAAQPHFSCLLSVGGIKCAVCRMKRYDPWFITCLNGTDMPGYC